MTALGRSPYGHFSFYHRLREICDFFPLHPHFLLTLLPSVFGTLANSPLSLEAPFIGSRSGGISRVGEGDWRLAF